MTFSGIVTEVSERVGQTSSDALTRIGRIVNARYRRVTSSIGVQIARRTKDVSATTTPGTALLTFSNIEQIDRVVDARDLTNLVVLEAVTVDALRRETPAASDTPTRYAIYTMGASSVTVLLDVQPQTAFALLADGLATASTLAGSQVPAFPEDYHDILVEGAVADELRRMEKRADARDAEVVFERRLSELRLFVARSGGAVLRQGQGASASGVGTNGAGGAVIGGQPWTQTGLVTFDRDPSAPFAVTSGSAVVTNLDADLLDGQHGSYYNAAANLTGYIPVTSIPNDAVTYARMQNVSAASRLLGRGSAGGSGDPEEITLGTGLAMSATTLNVTTTADDAAVILALQVFS